MKEIGPRIKKLREQRGLTLRELGDRINIAYSHLSRVENGQRIPNLELLNTLANFFDVDMVYFFGDKKQVPEEFKDQIEWIAFGQEMEEYDLSPEEIKDILSGFLKRLGGNKD